MYNNQEQGNILRPPHGTKHQVKMNKLYKVCSFCCKENSKRNIKEKEVGFDSVTLAMTQEENNQHLCILKIVITWFSAKDPFTAVLELNDW